MYHIYQKLTIIVSVPTMCDSQDSVLSALVFAFPNIQRVLIKDVDETYYIRLLHIQSDGRWKRLKFTEPRKTYSLMELYISCVLNFRKSTQEVLSW